MSRKIAREEAFKLIFEYEISKKPLKEILEYYTELENAAEEDQRADLTSTDLDYVTRVVVGLDEAMEDIDSAIAAHSEKWDISRIGKVSLAAMRLAIYEMRYCEDIPVGVSVHEAVEITKKYDAPERSGFVNALLSTVAKEA